MNIKLLSLKRLENNCLTLKLKILNQGKEVYWKQKFMKTRLMDTCANEDQINFTKKIEEKTT
jgi:hypothetical protein